MCKNGEFCAIHLIHLIHLYNTRVYCKYICYGCYDVILSNVGSSISHLSCQKLNSAFQSEEQRCEGSLFPRKYPPASFHAHCPTPLLHGIESRGATKSSLNLLEVVQASSFLSGSTSTHTLQTLADLAGNQKSSQKSVAEPNPAEPSASFANLGFFGPELPCESESDGGKNHKHL